MKNVIDPISRFRQKHDQRMSCISFKIHCTGTFPSPHFVPCCVSVGLSRSGPSCVYPCLEEQKQRQHSKENSKLHKLIVIIHKNDIKLAGTDEIIAIEIQVR